MREPPTTTPCAQVAANPTSWGVPAHRPEGPGRDGRRGYAPRPVEPFEFNARLTHREDLTESLCIFRVRPEHGPPPEFVPGQFVQLALPETVGGRVSWVRRSYSIASAPGLPELEIYFQIVTGGAFSELFRPLGPGARLWLGPRAHGHFTLLPVTRGADVVAIATGTGLAPFVSMLRHHADDPPWGRFCLLHGARRAAELGYRDWLEGRAAADPRLRYVPSVTREPEGSGWRGERGRLQHLLAPERFAAHAGFELDPARCHVLLCGNPAMLDEVQGDLVARGFRAYSRREGGNLHLERFW